MARGVRFLLGFRQYPFLKKNGPGIPVFGYCPKDILVKIGLILTRYLFAEFGETKYFVVGWVGLSLGWGVRDIYFLDSGRRKSPHPRGKILLRFHL